MLNIKLKIELKNGILKIHINDSGIVKMDWRKQLIQ